MKRLLAVAPVFLWAGVALANPEMTVDLPGGATMDFVWIEPGTFIMGSPLTEFGREGNEGPQHRVTLTQGFWLGKYEITRVQWHAITGTAPWSGEAGDSHPATYISWHDVKALVYLLNQAARDSLYRMPTEAEWEYACRAGTTTRWSFGDDESQLGEYAWYGEGFFSDPHAVGTKLPNPWGLYDMHGNVTEWVDAEWGEYGSADQTDPPGVGTADLIGIRNGSVADNARCTRSAYRYSTSEGFPPDIRSNEWGGRLLRMGSTPAAVEAQTWGQVKTEAR